MSSNFGDNPSFMLAETYIIPEDEEEKDLKLRQYLGSIATSTNSKDSGVYNSLETVTGRQFMPTFSTDTASSATYRGVLRKVIDFGSLPNNTTKNVAHGITFEPAYSIVNLYGAATQATGATWTAGISLPHASTVLATTVVLSIDATNIGITTGSDRTAFTRSFVVIEWITTI